GRVQPVEHRDAPTRQDGASVLHRVRGTEHLLHQLTARHALLPPADHHGVAAIRSQFTAVRLRLLAARSAEFAATEGVDRMSEAPLPGKVASVTGAARGKGRSHCIRWARAGADIVAIDACAPVAEHNGYPPATPEDLAETVSLVEGEGRKIVADEIDV